MRDAKQYIKTLDLLVDEVQQTAASEQEFLKASTLAKLLFAAEEVGISRTKSLKLIESGYPDFKAGAILLIERIKRRAKR